MQVKFLNLSYHFICFDSGNYSLTTSILSKKSNTAAQEEKLKFSNSGYSGHGSFPRIFREPSCLASEDL